MPTTRELIDRVREATHSLASGEPSDFDSLSDEEYKGLAKEVGDLAAHLESIAEGLELASSEEFTALLAQCCDELERTRKT